MAVGKAGPNAGAARVAPTQTQPKQATPQASAASAPGPSKGWTPGAAKATPAALRAAAGRTQSDGFQGASPLKGMLNAIKNDPSLTQVSPSELRSAQKPAATTGKLMKAIESDPSLAEASPKELRTAEKSSAGTGTLMKAIERDPSLSEASPKELRAAEKSSAGTGKLMKALENDADLMTLSPNETR